MTLDEQLVIMKQYAQMMLERGDYHGLWDAAIDLQRLQDRMQFYENKSPNKCAKCEDYIDDIEYYMPENIAIKYCSTECMNKTKKKK